MNSDNDDENSFAPAKSLCRSSASVKSSSIAAKSKSSSKSNMSAKSTDRISVTTDVAAATTQPTLVDNSNTQLDDANDRQRHQMMASFRNPNLEAPSTTFTDNSSSTRTQSPEHEQISLPRKRFLKAIRRVLFIVKCCKWAASNYQRTMHRYMSFSQVFVEDEPSELDEHRETNSAIESDAQLQAEMMNFNKNYFKPSINGGSGGGSINYAAESDLNDSMVDLIRKPLKSNQDLKCLRNALKTMNCMSFLTRQIEWSKFKRFFQTCWLEEYSAKRIIVKQDYEPEFFYFVLSGSLVCTYRSPGVLRKSVTVCFLEKGMTFGELAILENGGSGGTHSCTVTTRKHCKLLVCTRDDFLSIFIPAPTKSLKSRTSTAKSIKSIRFQQQQQQARANNKLLQTTSSNSVLSEEQRIILSIKDRMEQMFADDFDFEKERIRKEEEEAARKHQQQLLLKATQQSDADLAAEYELDDPMIRLPGSDEAKFLEDLRYLRQHSVLSNFQLKDLVRDHPDAILKHAYKRGELILSDSNKSQFVYLIKSGSLNVLTKVDYNKYDKTNDEQTKLLQLEYRDKTKKENKKIQHLEKKMTRLRMASLTISSELDFGKLIDENRNSYEETHYEDECDECEMEHVNNQLAAKFKNLTAPELFIKAQMKLLKDHHMEVTGALERRHLRFSQERQTELRLRMREMKFFLEELKKNEATAKNVADPNPLDKFERLEILNARVNFRKTDYFNEHATDLVLKEELNRKLKSLMGSVPSGEKKDDYGQNEKILYSVREVNKAKLAAHHRLPGLNQASNSKKNNKNNINTNNKSDIKLPKIATTTAAANSQFAFDDFKPTSLSMSLSKSIENQQKNEITTTTTKTTYHHQQQPTSSSNNNNNNNNNDINYQPKTTTSVILQQQHQQQLNSNVSQKTMPQDKKNNFPSKQQQQHSKKNMSLSKSMLMKSTSENNYPVTQQQQQQNIVITSTTKNKNNNEDNNINNSGSKSHGIMSVTANNNNNSLRHLAAAANDENDNDDDDDNEEDENVLRSDRIKMFKLVSGDCFGLGEILFNIQPSMQLISNGCECLLIPKDYFVLYSLKSQLSKLRVELQPYPNKHHLDKSYKSYMDWKKFARDTLNAKIANRRFVWNKTSQPLKPIQIIRQN